MRVRKDCFADDYSHNGLFADHIYALWYSLRISNLLPYNALLSHLHSLADKLQESYICGIQVSILDLSLEKCKLHWSFLVHNIAASLQSESLNNYHMESRKYYATLNIKSLVAAASLSFGDYYCKNSDRMRSCYQETLNQKMISRQHCYCTSH